MHIELVDTLRCPSSHEETWLVASVSRFEGRNIVEGALGCPVCRRQYAIVRGEVDFTTTAGERGHSRDGDRAYDSYDVLETPVPDEGESLRARALLSLADGGGVVLLGGEHARMAHVLEDHAQVMPLLLNPPPWVLARGRAPSALRVVDGLPVAAGALRGAWLDQATASSPATLAAVARALRRGGRLVAPVAAVLPDGAHELARDAHEWVAERVTAWDGGPSAPVSLERR